MSTRYFRAGVGTVIYNTQGNVLLFERAQHPVGVWQFQQGGIDLGEDPNTTLWRELSEEAGISKEDILDIDMYPDWIPYQDLHSFSDHSIPRIGQVHRWFFLRVADTYIVDLAKATDEEFKNWKWCTFTEAIESTGTHKQPVYKQLESYFYSHIQKDLR